MINCRNNSFKGYSCFLEFILQERNRVENFDPNLLKKVIRPIQSSVKRQVRQLLSLEQVSCRLSA